MPASVLLFATCVAACLNAVYSQTAVIPLIQGSIQPAGTGFIFTGSVTLIRDGTNNIVVDTPSASDANGRTTMLNGFSFSALTQYGLNPLLIQTLVITHGHPDHFGHDSLFTNARSFFNSFSRVGTSYTPVTYQNNMTAITTSAQMWQTPGHTPQDVSLIVKNVPQRGIVAVVGDLILDAMDALNPATSQVGSAFNVQMLIASRNKVICASDWIVPGHGAMFQVTAQMRTMAQCAGGGTNPSKCATTLNQILVNDQCYNLMLPNSNGCLISQQCAGGSTCVNSVCRCPGGSTADNGVRCPDARPIVTTTLGQVQGRYYATKNNYRMQEFILPYAEPPKRFAKPKPLQKPFNGLYDATESRPHCTQLLDDGTQDPQSGENCLFLHVLAPITTPTSATSLYPVLFWPHGGGLNLGGCCNYDTDAQGDNFVNKNLIIVQPSYRVGPFGFFTTGTADAPGNYGVWDALEALKWTRNQIKAFGGDPNRIILYGQGAGAVISQLLSMSPYTSGMFAGTVFLSTDVFDPKVSRNDDVNLQRSQNFSIRAGCDNNSPGNLWQTGRRAKVLECLMKKPLATLVEALSTLPAPSYYWRPRVDLYGGILPEAFDSLAMKRPNVPVLMGVTKDESTWDLVILPEASGRQLPPNSPDLVIQECDNQLPTDIFGSSAATTLRQACKQHFLQNVLNGNLSQADRANPYFWIQQAARVGSSLHYFAPVYKDASFFRWNGNTAVFLYSLDYTRDSAGPLWQAAGAFHNLDIILTENFAAELIGDLIPSDIAVRDLLTTMVANFAKLSSPLPPGYAAIQQPPMGSAYSYLSINVNPVVKAGFYQNDSMFWINNGAV